MNKVTFPLSKWENKVWLTLGDSITAFDQTLYNGTVLRGYQTVMKETMGFAEYINRGIPGKTMAAHDEGSTHVVGEAQNLADIDVVTIFAGTNDFKLNKPIGSLGAIGDTAFDTSTFYGAYRSLLENFLTRKPTLKIYLWTPLQRDNAGYDVNYVNPAGHRLVDYVNAIQSVGLMYAIPVLDLYAVSGITKKTLDTFTWDGLHPNNSGYERIAEVAKGFMEVY